MSGKRVLVVERDDAVRLTVQRMLESHGHEVVAVNWPNAAFEPMAQNAFDIALIGRGGNLFQSVHVLAWVIRAMYADIVLILMTGQGMTSDELKPFDGTLLKPFSIDQIGQLVDVYCPDQPVKPPVEILPL